MNPCPPQDLLNRLLSEDLPSLERSSLETHIEKCTICQEKLEQMTDDSLVRRSVKADGSTKPALLPLRQGAKRQTPPPVHNPTNPPSIEPSADPGDEEFLAFLSPSDAPGSLGRLGEYEILSVVGRGGMGVVLKGWDPLLRRTVAIKLLAPQLTVSATARKRFIREAQAAAAIRDENVVAIHGVREAPVPYLVMEFIDGMTLDDRIKQTGPMDVAEVLRIGIQIVQGLASAHAQGLVHRDIKPGNILLEGSRVKLTDFGLARPIEDASLTQSGVIAGTPLYMSPEQARGEAVDHRADLFSLGSVLYTMCTGGPPFQAGNPMAVLKCVCEVMPPSVRKANPAMSASLAAVVQKLLTKDAAARYQSAAEVAAELERQLAEPEATQPRPAAPRGVLRRFTAVAVLVGLMVAGTAAWIAFRPPPREREDGSRPDAPDQRTAPPSKQGPPSKAEVAKTEHEHVDPAKLQRKHPPGELAPTFKNRFGMEFVRIPRGKFWPGGSAGKPGKQEVHIPYDLYLGKHEVTQEQWLALMGTNPSAFSRTGEKKEAVKDLSDDELKRFPVEMITWDDAKQFLEKLNQQDAEPGWVYCLPLSAEWEYACRGGPMTNPAESAFDFYFDQPTNRPAKDKANIMYARGRTSAVGSYPPNRLGLHDMHGNVNEWCADSDTAGIADDKGKKGPPPGPKEGAPDPRPPPRLHRGGSWEFNADRCGACSLEALPPFFKHDSLGLRVARVYIGLGPPPEPERPQRRHPQGAMAPTVTNRCGMILVRVPKGKFWMGGGDGIPGKKEVEIPYDFYLGKHEVTQGQWQAVTGSNPSHFSRTGAGASAVKDVSDEDVTQFPVEMVSCHDVDRFLAVLNHEEKETGWRYCLPSTEEWEYACRGGPMTDRSESVFEFHLERPTNQLPADQANYGYRNSLKRPRSVGSYPANRLGLHDMHGNISEWCDADEPSPHGMPSPVHRGGSWKVDAWSCRTAGFRTLPPPFRSNDLGVRVARVYVGRSAK